MDAKEYWALNGVRVPKGEFGIIEMPNLDKRKLYVFLVNIPDLVRSFLRFRLRKYSRYNKKMNLFSLKLPEFSNYTLERMLDAAEKLGHFSDDIWNYIHDRSIYYPYFDSQSFIKMSKFYAGPPPITKQHVIKVLHLAAYMAVQLTRMKYRSLLTISQIEDVCINNILRTEEYLEFLNGYPLHTWFHPLETFEVTNDEVAMSVVRSRIVKKFDLRDVALRDLYHRFPDLKEMFKKDLPEYTSYQIRCVIDELEDMDKAIDNYDLSWIKGYRPSNDNANEYLNKILKAFQNDRGPHGILKAIHITCLIIENLLESDPSEPAAAVLTSLIKTLNSDKLPFKDLLVRHPWHHWYKQYLPLPETEHERYSSFDRCKYRYPQFTKESNEPPEENSQTTVDCSQALDVPGEMQDASAQAPAASYGYLPYANAQIPGTAYGYQPYATAQAPSIPHGHQPYYLGQAHTASDGYQTGNAGQIPAATYDQHDEGTCLQLINHLVGNVMNKHISNRTRDDEPNN